jgi:signal transduction histidine kinase
MRHTSQLNLSRLLISSLSSSHEPETLLRQLLRDTNEFLHSPVGFIYLLDADAQALTFQLGYNCELQDVEHSVLSVAQSASGEVISKKEPIEFDDIQQPQMAYLCKEFARRHNLTRYLAAPLMDSHFQVSGVLGLHPRLGRNMRSVERKELIGAARVIALAMEASRTREREQQVRRLAKLGNVLTASGNLRTILIALEQVRESVSVQAVYFFEEGRLETDFSATAASFPELSSLQVRRLAQRHFDTKLPVIKKIHRRQSHASTRESSLLEVFVIASTVGSSSKPRGYLVFVDTFDSISTPRMPALSKDTKLIEIVSHLFGIFLENLEYLESLRAEENRREALTLSLAHEFLIPITGLTSRITKLKEVCLPQFALRDRAQPPAVYFDDINGALEDLRELTTGILSLTEQQCNYQPTFLYKVLLQVYDMLKEQAFRRRLEIEFKRQEFLASIPQLSVDRALVTHVIYNVLKNAIKYSFRRTCIRIRAAKLNDCCEISFENWGIGIPPGEAAKIFEPFQQGSNAHQADVRGAGLGLFICKRIMELHSGSIMLTRAISPTVFTIRFPLAR